MSLGAGSADPRKEIEVATLALLQAYPIALRTWGMRITVTDDGTAGNNTTWVFTKGLIDSNKANNSNFQKESALYAGGGSSGGAGGFQVSDGSGGFTAVGSHVAGKTTLPAVIGAAGSFIQQVGVTNKKKVEGFIIEFPAWTGIGSTNAIMGLDTTPNNTQFTVELLVSGIQFSGVRGSSGFAYKLRATFRRDNAGTIARIGASTQEWVVNDTGDAFPVTPKLDVYITGVGFTHELTTAKTFNVSCYATLIMHE